MSAFASITVGIDPTIDVGPIELAWHWLTIALGLALGLWTRDGARPATEWTPTT